MKKTKIKQAKKIVLKKDEEQMYWERIQIQNERFSPSWDDDFNREDY
jgi:hypothetical protein